MNAQQRENLRIALLNTLDANHTDYGLGLKSIRMLARVHFGRLPDEADVKRELQYLQDKGLVEAMDRNISPELTKLRINAAGRDWLAKEGF